ncbi:MAG: hypothetical protein ACI93N_001442 [Flavobacteriaceae bacterium]|jgi:hypothetical protein
MINTKFMNKIKKIVFFTLALAFSFKGYSQIAVAKNMNVGATLLQIMTIADTNSNLNFGRIIHKDPAQATVILGTAAVPFVLEDTRVFSANTANAANSNIAGTQTALGLVVQHAVYTVTGSYDHAYTITLSATDVDITLVADGTDKMNVSNFTANVLDADDTNTKISFTSAAVSMTGMGRADNTTFNGSTVITFGATLTIGANQRGGVYSNNGDALTVTVNYE